MGLTLSFHSRLTTFINNSADYGPFPVKWHSPFHGISLSHGGDETFCPLFPRVQLMPNLPIGDGNGFQGCYGIWAWTLRCPHSNPYSNANINWRLDISRRNYLNCNLMSYLQLRFRIGPCSEPQIVENRSKLCKTRIFQQTDELVAFHWLCMIVLHNIKCWGGAFDHGRDIWKMFVCIQTLSLVVTWNR